ncbi:MAG TPA: protein kinase [Pseudomonadota bacterium]|nr:protein kinase [Pseudomonadota bacterium]
MKPGNVMVSRRDDGGWKAVLMDFGLASDANASDRLTQSGSVMGTPVYMAPEQASGEVSRLDRRTDVYSLGAMFYELLVGEPPFDGATMVGILWAVMHKEPVPLRRRNPSVPADLELITLKCLHKEMQHRYESAQSLAEDLGRHLAGEPISARQVAWRYRLRGAVRKHRFALALVTIGLLGIGVSAGIWAHGRMEVGRQARMSQSFGQRIEIEMFLRYAYALPLHDTRTEKRVIRDRMRSIQDGLSRLDGEAAAMAHYALGRGHFALKEYEAALEHLEAAHRSGLRNAEVEYALGRTLGEIYNAHFKDLQRRSGQRFLVEKEKIDKRYLGPAQTHLRKPSGLGGESKAFAEALLAYYGQRYEEALHKAEEAIATEPWLYEPKKLQGDVYYAYGFAKQKRGLYDEARADYHRAAALYHTAGEMARSDSATHGAEADAWVQVMEVDKTQGRSPKDALDRALAACDRAMAADPENASAMRKKVWAYIRWAEFQSSHGEDPRAAAQQAISAADQAVRLNPKNAFPYAQVGNAYLLIARAEHTAAQDSRASEERASAAFQKSVEVNPMFSWAWNDFAVLHITRAEWLAMRGGEYRDELSAGIKKLERALDAEPDYYVAYSNLVDAYELLARYELERGRSPEAWIEKALETSNRSLQVNPNYYQTYRNLASIYALRAEFESASGRSPRESLERALSHIEQATRANSDDAETHRLRAQILWFLATDRRQQGQDARALLQDALSAIKRSIEVSPNQPDSYLVELRILMLSAQGNPTAGTLLAQAHAAAHRARALSAQSPAVYVGLGTLALATAKWQLGNQRPADREITEGLAALDHALSLNPGLATALAMKGELYLLRSQGRPALPMRRQLERQALGFFAQAIERNPLLKREIDLHRSSIELAPLGLASTH